jgi:hypothetical protein
MSLSTENVTMTILNHYQKYLWTLEMHDRVMTHWLIRCRCVCVATWRGARYSACMQPETQHRQLSRQWTVGTPRNSMKMTVVWAVTPCGLVEVYRRFRGACSLTLMMEAASTSETSANFYHTTRRNNPEDFHLHTRRRENLKCHSRTACLCYWWCEIR